MTHAWATGKAALRIWQAYWFRPAPATDLGIVRLLFFGGLLAYYAATDVGTWAGVADVFWRPVSFFQLVPLEPRSTAVLAAAGIAWRASLALAAVGFLTRISTVAAFIGSLYVLGIPDDFGKLHHYDGILVLAMFVLAASRCGDAVSVDRLLHRGREAPAPSGEYRWPIRTIWVAMSLVFVAAAVAKMRYSGLAWITSDNLRLLLVMHQYHVANADPLVDWGIWLSRVPLVPQLIAAATVIVETTYVTVLFSARARVVLVPAAILMQLGIRALMGPTFDQFLICNVFWIPWTRVVAHVSRRSGLARRGVLAGSAA